MGVPFQMYAIFASIFAPPLSCKWTSGKYNNYYFTHYATIQNTCNVQENVQVYVQITVKQLTLFIIFVKSNVQKATYTTLQVHKQLRDP